MSEWISIRIDQLCRFHRGISWSSEQETTESDPNAVPVLRIPNVQQKLDTTDLLWLRRGTTAIWRRSVATQSWTLMVGSNGNPDRVGNCVFVEEAAGFLFASFLIGIEPMKTNLVSPEYLFRLFSSSDVQSKISGDVQGSTGLTNINLGRLRRMSALIPSFSEQRRIVDVLRSLDSAITQTEALIAKMQHINAGLMHDLFTRGVTPDGKLRPTREESPKLYKQSPLGWVPVKWEITEFGRCLISDPQNGVYKPPGFYGEAGTCIVRIDSFNWGEGLSVDSLKRVNLTPGERRIYSLTVEDILVNRVNSIDYVGKSTIISEVPEPIVFESNMMRCRVAKDRLLPEFALKWLHSATAMAHFHSHAKSAIAQASVNQKDVTELAVAVPALDEQRAILDHLGSAVGAATEGQARLSKLRSLKSALMSDLLTGRVRVPEAAPGGP